MRSIPCRLSVLLVVLALVVPAATLTGLGVVGCSTQPAAALLPLASRGDRLTFGLSYQINLDQDSDLETVLVEEPQGSLIISDGTKSYKSRKKWQIAEAWVADTDRDGLAEIVALLDSDDGRHVGLFAYFGGEYRERLVTQALSPEPQSLAVVTLPMEQGGDLLLLVEKIRDNVDSVNQTNSASEAYDYCAREPYHLKATLYRWNGFGFTAVSQF